MMSDLSQLPLTKICAVEDIPMLGSRIISRDAGADVAVFRTAGNHVFALLDRCPHKGGPLSQGIVYGETVACPLHNWRIDLNDGTAAAPDVGCAQRFVVTVLDGVVYLLSKELATIGVTGADSAKPAWDKLVRLAA